eukprot:SAG31_NODE_42_length_31262_cov_46.416231_20_plen_36_part_00
MHVATNNIDALATPPDRAGAGLLSDAGRRGPAGRK